MADLLLPERAQRAVACTALWLLAAAAIIFVPLGDADAANSQNNNYQPFQCASNGTSGQGRRETMDLANNNVDSEIPNTYAFPCLSGVPWRVLVGAANNPADGTSVPTQNPWVLAFVRGIYAKNPSGNFNWGATGNSDLYRVAFKELQLCTGAGQPISQCGAGVNSIDTGTNAARNDFEMWAESSLTDNPKPVKNYVLRIQPDGPITIGGTGVMTDLMAYGNSAMTLAPDNIPAGGTGCGAAGGTKYPSGAFSTMHSCSGMQVSALSTLGWILGVKDFYLKQVDLRFQYLLTHGPNTADPYTDPPGGIATPLKSIRLPNTRFTVCVSTAKCNPSLSYPHDD